MKLTSLEAINYYMDMMNIQPAVSTSQGTDKLIAVLTIFFVPSTFVAVMLPIT
jgi:hypothetical protein